MLRLTANDPATLSLITHPVLALPEFTCCNLLPYCIAILRPCSNPRPRALSCISHSCMPHPVLPRPSVKAVFTSDTRHAHGPLPVPLMSSAASGPAVEYLVICGEDGGSRAISGLERSARAQHLDYHDKRRPWRPGSAIADYRKDCRSAPRTIHTNLQQNSIHRIGARALHESESGVM